MNVFDDGEDTPMPGVAHSAAWPHLGGHDPSHDQAVNADGAFDDGRLPSGETNANTKGGHVRYDRANRPPFPRHALDPSLPARDNTGPPPPLEDTQHLLTHQSFVPIVPAAADEGENQ